VKIRYRSASRCHSTLVSGIWNPLAREQTKPAKPQAAIVAPYPDNKQRKGKYHPSIGTLALLQVVRFASGAFHYAAFLRVSQATVFNGVFCSLQNSMVLPPGSGSASS
jgi:hypothetical protein